MTRPARPTALAADPAALWRGLDDDDPVGPLWRAAQIFRLVSFVYGLGFMVAVNGDLEHPAVAWILFAVLVVANIWWTTGYLAGFGRRWWFVAIEVAASSALMLSTEFVASRDWIAANQTWPTTLWMTNAALSAALIGGARWGLVGAVAISLTNYYVKGEMMMMNFGRNATAILLIAASMAVGMGASRARLMHERLTTAIRLAAQSAERERLAREVHDGVLQVLALISRRGREIGGPTAELAELAAEQERVLRHLIADAPPTVDDADRDLGPELRALAEDRIRVSTPGEPVHLDAAVTDEILAAVGNILDNVRKHAGPGAHTFVLLEDLDDEIVVSIRDDGVGIESGRLDRAAAEGRMGIARSIIGRIEDLGGRARLESAPGAGTEWELTVPVSSRRTQP